MYNPRANRVDDVATFHDLIEQAAFGHLVSHTENIFESSGLPLLLDRSSGQLGMLRAHFARANNQWKRLDGADVMVIVPMADGYVSPAWYPSKVADPKVVPTWNYEVVHAHGVARIHDDVAWVRRVVSDLTNQHEAARADDAATWQVADAPPDFIDRQLRSIVGVEIEVTRLDGKRKLSQNRADTDRRGVINGHEAGGAPRSLALADAMRRTKGWSNDPPTR